MFDIVVHKIELVKKKKTTQLSTKSTPSKKNNFIVIKSTHFVPRLTQLSAKSTWSQKPTWFQTIDSIVVKIDSICTTFHLIYLPLTGRSTINLFYLVWVDPTTTESFFYLFLTELILWAIKSILGMHTTHFFELTILKQTACHNVPVTNMFLFSLSIAYVMFTVYYSGGVY